MPGLRRRSTTRRKSWPGSPAWPISSNFAATRCCDSLPTTAWTGSDAQLVAGRGGILKAIPGGVYRVNARMLRELRASQWGEHPCNLGAPLAQEIAKATGAAAFIVDPPVVDEMWPLARYSGHPAFVRKSRFHALSQRAAARRAARELKIPTRKSI